MGHHGRELYAESFANALNGLQAWLGIRAKSLIKGFSLNAATAESNRTNTGVFRGAFCGPRTWAGLPGWLALTGFMPARVASSSGGESTASPSFRLTPSGLLFFIKFPLAAAGLAQADQADIAVSLGVDKNMEAAAERPKAIQRFSP